MALFKFLSVTSEAQAIGSARSSAWLRPVGITTDGAVMDRFHNRSWGQISRLKERLGKAVLVKLISGFIGRFCNSVRVQEQRVLRADTSFYACELGRAKHPERKAPSRNNLNFSAFDK